MVLYSRVDAKLGICRVYAQKLDFDLIPEDKKLLIWKEDGDIKKNYSFKFQISNDRSKFMVSLWPKVRKEEDISFKFKVFNADLSELYSNEAELKMPEKGMKFYTPLLNNNGDAFYLYKTEASENNNETDSMAGELKLIYRSYSSSGKMKKGKLDLGGLILSEANAIVNSRNNFSVFITCCAGKGQISSFVNIDIEGSSGEIISKTKNALDEKLIARVLKIQPGENNSSAAISSLFRITNNVATPDGSVYLVLEESGFGFSIHQNAEFYSGGIIVIKQDTGGKTLWCKIIPRNMHRINNSCGLGHSIIIHDNSFFLLYNDIIANEGYEIEKATTPPKEAKEYGRGTLMLVEFGNDGKMTRTILGKKETLGSDICVNSFWQYSPSNVLVEGMGKYNYGHLTIE